MAGFDSTLRWINLRNSLAGNQNGDTGITDGTNQTGWAGDDIQGSGYIYGDGGNGGITINSQAYTLGWVLQGGLGGVLLRDRVASASNDPRLCGMHGVTQNSAGFADFRIDVGAGTYEIHLGIGDNFDHANNYVAIYDDTTLKATVIDSASNHVADNFYDATGANYSRANWPASETGVTVTLATSQLRIRVGKAAFSSDTVCLACVGIKVPNVDVLMPQIIF